MNWYFKVSFGFTVDV